MRVFSALALIVILVAHSSQVRGQPPQRNISEAQAQRLIHAALQPLTDRVEALESGRLSYTWRMAVKQNSQDFTEGDFAHLLDAASSEYPILPAPTFSGGDWIGAFLVPLFAPEGRVEASGGFSTDLLRAFGDIYRRVEEPLFFDGVPHRLHVGRRPIIVDYLSGTELTWIPRGQLSRYRRFTTVTETAAFPEHEDGDYRVSRSAVLPVAEFDGARRYVHVALPLGTTPAPNRIQRAVTGSPNIAGQFSLAQHIIRVDLTEPYAVYSSATALDSATFSGTDLIVLPERDGILYHVAPTAFPNADVGFTWYAGFYSWAKTGETHPENPVDASVATGSDASSSTAQQVTMPGAAGLRYEPDPDRRYVRFLAQPATAPDIEGRYAIRGDYDYASLADAAAAAVVDWPRWTRQDDTFEIGGQTYHAYLNRFSTTRWSSSGIGGERFLVFRQP